MEAGAHQLLQLSGFQPATTGPPLAGLGLESPAAGQRPAARPQHPETIRDPPERLVGLQLPIPAGQPDPFVFAEIPVLKTFQPPGDSCWTERSAPHQPALQQECIGGFLAVPAAVTLASGEGLVETGQPQWATAAPCLDAIHQQIHIVAARRNPGHAEGVPRQAAQPFGKREVGVINGRHGQAQSLGRCQAGQLPHQGGLSGAHRSVEQHHGPVLAGAAPQIRQPG